MPARLIAVIAAAVLVGAPAGPGAAARPARAQLAAARLASAPGNAPVPPDPGAVPDAALDRTIHSEQLSLVAAAASSLVAAAEAAEADAARGLTTDETAYNRDRVEQLDAAGYLAADRAAAADAASTLRSDVAVRGRDLAQVGLDRRQLEAVAVGWYTGAQAGDPASLPASLAGTEQLAEDAGELDAITSVLEADLRADVAAAAAALTREDAATVALARAEGAEASAGAEASGSRRVVAAAAGTLAAQGAVVVAAEGRLQLAKSDLSGATAAFDGPEGSSPDPAPSILGQSALTAAQLVAWFDAGGYQAATRAPIEKLAGWYLSEGRAEGVRGDIAFAQAMVETGGFDSPDAVSDNNYAGIGHCDSCSAGLKLPSPQLGVRAQMQLLRTYADKGLTVAALPSPPVLTALDPGRQSRRGCCQTWSSLTGVWATDPDYGLTVLDLYQEMLSFAVGHQPPA